MSYRRRLLTEYMPTFRVAADIKRRVIAVLREDEDLGEICRAALLRELEARESKTATSDTTKAPHR